MLTTVCKTAPRPVDVEPTLPNHNQGIRAISHALGMKFATEQECFKALYDFGAEPLVPAIARAPRAKAPAFSIGALAQFSTVFDEDEQGCWHIWKQRAPDRNGSPIYKAYLNPSYIAFSRLCLRVTPYLLDRRVLAFKTVARRWMALRPDKFIVYFASPEDRHDWLQRINGIWADLPANPTPFTKNWSQDGAISTGTDPKDCPGASWRSTLLHRIAPIVYASTGQNLDAVLDQIAATGINPQTWAPGGDQE